MRDRIERYDLELQRKQTARLARDADEEITALGKELDVNLDFTLESLDRMEQAIVARWQKAGREERGASGRAAACTWGPCCSARCAAANGACSPSRGTPISG